MALRTQQGCGNRADKSIGWADFSPVGKSDHFILSIKISQWHCNVKVSLVAVLACYPQLGMESLSPWSYYRLFHRLQSTYLYNPQTRKQDTSGGKGRYNKEITQMMFPKISIASQLLSLLFKVHLFCGLLRTKKG